MMATHWIASLVVACVVVGGVVAEELPTPPVGCLARDQTQCFSSADVTGAVVGTLLVTLCLLALGYGIYRIYWRGRRGRHLVLVTDPERDAVDDYAFDNPCFRDGTPIGRVSYEKEPVKSDQKNRWSAWSPLGALVGGRGEKRRALDDSFAGEPQVSVVSLRSHDFTGLGFNVCGNMRDGIFVKDVLHRGPASESGRIAPGDRIDSVRISFRHMVFEDALTILSYASPYEVQLEVENPVPSSRPSTLIRTKRSSVEPADRICHPFYRSQSIADLAQMGKSSLLRVPDKTPRSKHNSWDPNDYPTLKLSPTPVKESAKESATVEKAASPSNPTSAAIVKPERAKRPPGPAPGQTSAKTSSPEVTPEAVNRDVKTDQVSKHQKFGVRVLPDPKAMFNLKSASDSPKKQEVKESTPIVSEDKTTKPANVVEAERVENEHNSMMEQKGAAQPLKVVVVDRGVTSSDMESKDVVDASTSVYDERGIDVGPEEEAENRRKASLNAELVAKHESKNKKDGEPIAGVDSHTHNVKQLLTKGFQNLKEKLHHHDKKKISPNPEVGQNPTTVDSDQKTTKSTSESSDDDHKVERQENKETKQVNMPEHVTNVVKDVEPGNASANVGRIPTKISEEVERAATAARNKRKSGLVNQDIQLIENVVNTTEVKPAHEGTDPSPDLAAISGVPAVKHRTRLPESLSEDSSGDDVGATSSALKKSNKRKAPIPPAPDVNKKGNVVDVQVVAVNLKNKDDEVMVDNPISKVTATQNIETHVDIPSDHNIQTMEVLSDPERHATNIPVQNNSDNEITNITVESSSNIQPNNEVKIQPQNELKIIVDNSDNMKQNSNSDSDSETEDAYSAGSQPKKGGTTIELNSSHITIHHSPSSDTVPLELENDSTRKAASMGDLSRLDTEQPISLLERAVSLDLADGAAPHGSKKRKAPLPPPGEDYMASVPDSDDTTLYRKEPRLDNALDTFQRRRLKKSSDWGTMEDAMQQGSMVPNPRKSLTSPTNIHIGLHDNEQPTSLTISVGEDDSEVFLESLPMSVGETQPLNVPIPVSRYFDVPGKSHFSPDADTPMQYASLTFTDGDSNGNLNGSPNSSDNVSSQRTVLHITPDPVSIEVSPPQVTVGQPSTSGPVSIIAEAESASPEDEVSGSRLLSFIQSEYRNSVHEEEPDTSDAMPSHSGETHTIFSSTPVARRDHPHRQHTENIQSSQISSSEGSSNINVVSSSTNEIPREDINNDTNNISMIQTYVEPSVGDGNVSVTSTSEAFVTAGSNIVDSTMTFMSNSDDEDSTWGHDNQPPELPTSPVPVLPSASSMTYITEIQVTSMTPEKTADAEVLSNGNSDEKEDPVSVSADSLENEVEPTESDNHTPTGAISQNGGHDQKRNNVTVTAIRSPSANSRIPMRIGTDASPTTIQSSSPGSPERSQIPLRTSSESSVPHAELSHIPVLSTFHSSGGAERSHIPMRKVSTGSQDASPPGSNGISEKRNKPVRPPVPPRKSDSSMSSVIAVEVPNTNRSPGQPQSNTAGGSKTIYGSSPTSQSGNKKFISYSSLTPRPVSGEAGSRNSSFEQWVFLDEGQGRPTNGNAHNGQDTSEERGGQHSTVVTLPVSTTVRPSSVSYIVLDSKQSSGKRGSQ